MKREEAIDLMNVIVHMLEPQYDTDRIEEAVEMAIEALKKEPCKDWHDVPSDEMTLEQARQAVKDLRKFVMDNHILPKLQPCEDAISRNMVLSEVKSGMIRTIDGENWKRVNDNVRDIQALPPIQPKAKVGHWIMKHRTHNEMKHYTGQDEMGETHTISVFESYEVDEPYCSECGKLAGDTSQNYCCACGAEMQEVKE